MKYGRWLLFAIGMLLVMGPFSARAGEVLICAFNNEKDIKVVLEGDASAGMGVDEGVKYKNKPTIGLMGNWTKAWDCVTIELNPVELAGVPEAVSIVFRGDTNMSGLIHFTIKDSKGETLRAVLCKAVNNAGWQELRAVLPWQEPTWDGGDGNRQLDPPCTLTSLMIFARRPVQATVYFADLKVKLPDLPAPAK